MSEMTTSTLTYLLSYEDDQDLKNIYFVAWSSLIYNHVFQWWKLDDENKFKIIIQSNV